MHRWCLFSASGKPCCGDCLSLPGFTLLCSTDVPEGKKWSDFLPASLLPGSDGSCKPAELLRPSTYLILQDRWNIIYLLDSLRKPPVTGKEKPKHEQTYLTGRKLRIPHRNKVQGSSGMTAVSQTCGGRRREDPSGSVWKCWTTWNNEKRTDRSLDMFPCCTEKLAVAIEKIN